MVLETKSPTGGHSAIVDSRPVYSNRPWSLEGLDIEQKFLITASTVVVALLIVGAGALYGVIILEGREPPAGITLVLGLALGQISNILLGKQTFQASNQLKDISDGADSRSRENQRRLDVLFTALEKEHPGSGQAALDAMPVDPSPVPGLRPQGKGPPEQGKPNEGKKHQ